MLSPEPAVRRFNRWCTIASAAWLLVCVPLTVRYRPLRSKDFPQFYMGGLIARHAAWESLYPNPNPDSLLNPGLRGDSTMKPRYAELAREYHVATGDEPRFIQAPPAALMYWPLALLPYPTAYVGWSVLMGACCLTTAWMAGRAFESLMGRPSIARGLLTGAISFSYLSYVVIRSTNSEMFMALSIALAAWAITRDRSVLGAGAVVLGSLIKYATAALLPVAIAARRWRMVNGTLAAGAALFALSVIIMGTSPWSEFVTHIFPRLSRPYEGPGNQSLTGALIGLSGQFPLRRALTTIIHAIAILSLLGIAAALWLPPRTQRQKPAAIYAACALMIAWLLAFSPLSWDRYSVYFFGLWGWLAWEATQSKIRAAIALTAMAATWAPWYESFGADGSSIADFHMLMGTIAIAGLGLWRVIGGAVPVAALERPALSPPVSDMSAKPV